jgi:hypothetical protein
MSSGLVESCLIVCPRCQHVNPHAASFCYYDGVALRGGDGRAHTQLPHDFVFPSGRTCHTYDELARVCQDEWDVARDLLQEGTFAQFLGGTGRIDLAQAAQRARANPDHDLGLEVFIGSLPTTTRLEGPRLELQPRRIVLGQMTAGETRDIELAIANRGKGLLIGDLSVDSGSSWLKLTGAAADRVSLKLLGQQRFLLHVDTLGLAALQSYAGKLTLISNGGIVEVSVALDLEPRPFATAPFAGVDRPRAMAERMREQPKEAVPVLESGEIARWFAANGWDYPVQGPPARGIGAVQQFFEAMGLARPPSVSLSESNLAFEAVPGENCRGHLTLCTPSRKWVFGIVESDAPWLRVLTPNVSGPRQAMIGFEVKTTKLTPGSHSARLRVIANGGQALTAEVRLQIERPPESVASRFLRPALAGAVAGVLLRLILAIPADLYARLAAASMGAGMASSSGPARRWLVSLLVNPHPSPSAGTLAGWLASPLAEPGFLKHFAVSTGWVAALVAIVILWRRGTRSLELLYAAIAGSVAGVIASASFACLLAWVDSLPRAILAALADAAGRPAADAAWFWTPLWIVMASLSWGVLAGAAALVLSCAGEKSRGAFLEARKAIASLLRSCGLGRVAVLFS